MAKSKKIKAKASKVRWPNEKVLSEIRERLSSDDFEGSTVLGPDADLSDRIKQNLCSKIVEYLIRNKLTQKELAKKLDIDEPEMSRILHYKIDRYTIDRLVDYVEVLYPSLNFKIEAA